MNLLHPSYAGGHVKKVLNCDRLFAVVEIRNGPVGKVIEHRPVDALQLSLLHQDADQGAQEAFGHRAQVVPDAGDVGRVIGVGDHLAVPDDQHAVLLVGAHIIDQAGDRARVHPLLFRRRDLPHLRGPDRRLALLSFRAHCECMDGRKSQERHCALEIHDAISPASVTGTYPRRAATLRRPLSSAPWPLDACSIFGAGRTSHHMG